MSKNERKITHYFLGVEKKLDKNETANTFGVDFFKRFCKYVNSLPDTDKMIDIKASEKIVVFRELSIYEKEGKKLVKILINSGKYNHSPGYLSRDTGKLRKSDKNQDEAFAEKTHLLGEIEQDGINVLLESRQAGAGIDTIVRGLNIMLKGFDGLNGSYFYYNNIAVDNFEDVINSMRKISLGSLYIDKKYIGSDGLQLSHGLGFSALRDEVILNVKAKKGHNIFKDDAINWIRQIAAKETNISRVRLEGKTDEGRTVIDTLLTKKADLIIVSLGADGLVDSFSIFSKLEEAFDISE